MNMLRYIWLKELATIQGGSLKGKLPMYDDGHVGADRNQYFGQDYQRSVTSLVGLEQIGTLITLCRNSWMSILLKKIARLSRFRL